MRVGLRRKLVVLLAVAVVVPPIACLAVVAIGGVGLHRSQVADSRRASAELRARLLRATIYRHSSQLRVLASHPAYGRSLREDLDRRKGRPPAEAAEADRRLEAGWSRLPDDAAEVRAVSAGDAAEMLRAFLRRAPAMARVQLLDPAGRMIAASHRPDVFRIPEAPQRIAELRSNRLRSASIEPGSSGLVLWALVPHPDDPGGRPFGLLRAEVSEAFWADAVAGVSETDVGEAVSDACGRLLYIAGDTPEARAAAERLDGVAPPGEGGIHSTDLTGVEAVWGFAGLDLPGYEPADDAPDDPAELFVWVGGPVPPPLAIIRPSGWWTLAGLAGLVCVVFWAGVRVVDLGVVRRLDDLRQAARRVGGGDFSNYASAGRAEASVVMRVSPELLGEDEISDLVRDFDKMGRSLADSYGQLENRVAARTAELERAVRGLADSEARFRAITETAWDAVVSADGVGRITAFNNAAERMFGRPRSEALTLSAAELLDVRHRPGFRSKIAEYLSWQVSDSVGGRMELEGLAADGRSFPVEVSVSVYRLGASPEFTIIFRDVTERRAAEAALRDSERRYRSVVEALEEGILLLDPAGTINTFNSSAVRILGIPADRLLGVDMHAVRSRVIHEDGRDFPPDSWPALYTLRTGKPASNAVMGLTRPDGSLVWISVNSRAVFGEDGEGLQAVVVSFSDVTDRLRAVKALRDSEALYQSLVENLPQNIFRVDLEGRFTFANRRFCNLVGRTLGQIIGRTDYDLFPAELAAKYREDDMRVARTGQIFQDVETHRSGGRTISVQVIKTPVYDFDGRCVGVQGIFWDITENKKLQDDLVARSAELEAANRRLRETQGQMIQQEKLASLGQLTAGVAHEINNPLAFVINNLAVLERDVRHLSEIMTLYREALPALRSADAEAADHITEAEAAVDLSYTLANLGRVIASSRGGLKRVQQIVLDLRNFSRLDRAEREEADLDAGLAATIDILAHEIKKRSLTVHRGLGGLTAVPCYPAKINQVFLNILLNAVQASDEGKALWVSTRAADGASGPEAVVEFRDEGCGMPPEVQARIFDPFFTTKPQGEGTGLGLSICYGIVRDHGGRIEVESAPGAGTTFRVILPMGRAETPAEPEAQRPNEDRPDGRDAAPGGERP
jgi:PAS domain S-box-containing protein